jgi:hypothetical protein
MMEHTMNAGTRERAFRPEMAERVGSGTRTPGWDLGPERRIDDGETLANALGWFSIGLGALEIMAPRGLARWLGMEGSEGILRLYGFREVGKGIGILSSRRPTGWMWGRLAGDFLDLATLAPGLSHDNPKRGNVVFAMTAVAGVAALDTLAAVQLARGDDGRRQG